MNRRVGHHVSHINGDATPCDCTVNPSPAADPPRHVWSSAPDSGTAAASTILSGDDAAASGNGSSGAKLETNIDQVRQLLAGLPTADRELYRKWVTAWDKGDLERFLYRLNNAKPAQDPAAHLLCLEWAGLACRRVGFGYEPVLAMGALGVQAALKVSGGYKGEHPSPLVAMVVAGKVKLPSQALANLVRAWELVWGRPASFPEVAYLVRWASGPQPFSPEEIAKSAALAAEHNPGDPGHYTEGVLFVRRRRRQEIPSSSPVSTVVSMSAPARPETWPSVYALSSLSSHNTTKASLSKSTV